jgi:hypothetical protein
MVIYQKARLKVAEFYFDEREQHSAADMVRFRYRPSPVPNCTSTDRHTTQLDLRVPLDILLARMKADTRHKIRRAEKDGCSTEFATAPDREWLDHFVEFYDRFATGKKLTHANRPRLDALNRHGSLALSRARAADGTVLVYHAYIRSGKCARVLHSSSLFREADKEMATTIGRANRLLHWAVIQRFREDGLETYDLGGWYTGHDDQAKIAINQFKAGFGGSIVQQYDCDRFVTWKASAAWRVRNLVIALRGRLN